MMIHMTAPRTRWLLLLGGLVVVAVGAVVALLLSRSDPQSAEPRGPMPLGDHQPCTDQILLYVKTDDEMTRIAAALANDAQFRKIYTETGQQAQDRYRRIFAGQPELRDLAGNGSLGAVIHAIPASGAGTLELAGRLRTQFPEVRKADPILRDEPPPGMTEPAAPCPPSGEFPK